MTLLPPPSKDDIAREALVGLTTAGKDVEFETLKKIVSEILHADSEDVRALLPAIIAYLRNHQKSLASRQFAGKDGEKKKKKEEDDDDLSTVALGTGQRLLSRKLIVCLCDMDIIAGKGMLALLSSYGSWKDLTEVIQLFPEAKVKPETQNEVVKTVSKLFSDQLLSDLESCKKWEASGAGTSGVETSEQRLTVSQASKYCPHESRKRQSSKKFKNKSEKKKEDESASAYVDEQAAYELQKQLVKRIRERMFPNAEANQVKKLFRQARVRLNNANGHIIEKYLSEKRAEEAHPASICAGPMARMPSALLNIKGTKGSEGGKQEERSTDPGRRVLKERLTKSLLRFLPPSPSDIKELSEKLLSMNDWTEEDKVSALGMLIRRSYDSAVNESATALTKSIKSAKKAAKLAEIEHQEGPTNYIPEILIALDLSSASATSSTLIKVGLTLALLIADVSKHVSKNVDGEADVSKSSSCVLFVKGTETLPVPVENEDEKDNLHADQRLARLIDAAQVFQEQHSKVMGTVDYTAVMRVFNAADHVNQNIIFASDFITNNKVTNTEEEANQQEQLTMGEAFAMLKNTDKRTISLYRMHNPAPKRVRQIEWDANDPRMYLCIVLDTTGSMGPWIQKCQQNLTQILNDMSSMSEGLKVECSFVSYKDFGDANHLEVVNWVSNNDVPGMVGLTKFVNNLQASGGGDAPEDVAGGFEKALKLFEKLESSQAAPGAKVLLHITDAWPHGLSQLGDSHFRVTEKERLVKASKSLFVDQKVEFLFENCGAQNQPGPTLMNDLFDSILTSAGSIAQELSSGSTSTSFRGLMVDALSSIASAAVIGPNADGIDTYAGIDFSVAQTMLMCRLNELLAKATAAAKTAKAGAQVVATDEVDVRVTEADENVEKEEEEESDSKFADPVDGSGDASSSKEKAISKTAFEMLRGKLERPEFGLVFEMLAGVPSTADSVFASFQPAPMTASSQDKCFDVLLAGSLSVCHLRDAGFPNKIVEEYTKRLELRAAGKL